MNIRENGQIVCAHNDRGVVWMRLMESKAAKRSVKAKTDRVTERDIHLMWGVVDMYHPESSSACT